MREQYSSSTKMNVPCFDGGVARLALPPLSGCKTRGSLAVISAMASIKTLFVLDIRRVSVCLKRPYDSKALFDRKPTTITS